MIKWIKSFFSKETEPVKEQLPTPESLDGKLVIIKAGFEESKDGEPRIRVEVDYDDTFVKSLRSRGYIGTDDHNIVMKYVADVHRSILQNNNIGFD